MVKIADEVAEIKEEVAQVKTDVALLKQSFNTICTKLDAIKFKIEKNDKVEDIHEKIMGNLFRPKTGLQKAGGLARDIRDIIVGVAILITAIAFIIKIDFSTLIK